MNFFLENPMLVTYIFLKLDILIGVAVFIAVVGTLALLFTIVMIEGIPSHFKKWIAVLISAATLSIFAPSAKDVAIMYGVSTGVAIGKSAADSPITSKSLELLNIYVEKELDQAKKDLEKSK